MSLNVTYGKRKMWRDHQAVVSHIVGMPPDRDTADQMREIGRRLQATRQALGLKQEDLASSIGVNRTTYTNWETGKRLPDPLAIGRLATRYGTTMDWIYLGDMSGLHHSLAVKIEPLMSASSRIGGA